MAAKPPKVKRKGKANAIGNEEGAIISQRTNVSWNESLVKILLLVVRDYHKFQPPEVKLKWNEILSTFEQVCGRSFTKTSIKNKFAEQKRIWQDWNDLRYKETGCGWNNDNGRVTASPEWWERKFKESDKYKHFRKSGVDPATSELWDQVFGFISATGKNYNSPSMDPSMQQALAMMPSHPAVVDKSPTAQSLCDDPSYDTASLIDQDHRLNEQVNQETLDNIQLDSVVDQDFLQQKHQIVTGVPSSSCPLPGRPVANKSLFSSLDSTRVKKKSRSSPHIDRFARLEARGEKMLALFEGEINQGSSAKGDNMSTKYYQEDAMIAVKVLIDEGLLEEGTDLWCFPRSELRKPESCIAFLTVEKNEMRLKWLEYEFKIHNAHLGLN